MGHLYKTFNPFNGCTTSFDYQQKGETVLEASRNKYSNLMSHYKALVDYI